MYRRTFLLSTLGTALASSMRAAPKSLGTLAYVEADGLTVRDLPDGEPRKVLGTAVEFPRLSPSGKWILYTQNDKAYVVSIDGKIVRLIGDAAKWSPAADELWARNEDVDTLQLFSPRNDWSVPLATIRGGDHGVLSHDGSEMIYSRYLSGGVDDMLQSTALTRVSLKGGAELNVVTSGDGDWTPCLWTRDGKSLVYWAQDEFSVSEGSDGNKLFIVPVSGGKGGELGVFTLLASDYVALSPTRNELAVTDGEGRYEWIDKRLATVDLDTLAVRYLTPENLAAFSPVWSPDGNRIAYSAGPVPKSKDESDDMLAGLDGGKSLNALFAKRRIWIIDRAAAQSPRLLTSTEGYHDEQPLWSADGQYILFMRSDQSFNDIESMTSDNQSLWLAGQDGANPVQVTGTLYRDRDSGGPEFRRAAFDWLR
jgi:dipeptidyl aminopeptidase/acylaminoacyl peptidase